ncbi:MAG TPA: hypothetical protein VFP12_16125 [Allosphingosinicella sp.]|nr:hypothetical protein [Allosphingosinicella sp.]
MAAKVRVFSVVSVELELRGGESPQLTVIAHGYVVSSGWADAELVPLEKKLSADGILDLDFVATPPGEFDMPLLSPVSAVLEWKTGEVGRLMGVRVVARTNEIVRLVVRDAAKEAKPPIGETTQIAGEGQHPHFAALRAAGDPTTMATGEEGPPPMSTMATGEETVFSTTLLGEHGGGYPPTTLMLGEEGGGYPPTTHMLGEEGGGYPPTTLMLGEEGGGYPPTTHMLGEEGGGLPPTTKMLGEEGGGLPPTTHMLGEEGGGLPPTTQMLGEEGGGLPPTTHMLGEEGGGLPPTTQMLGEEGGGLPPTTQMLGEEGGGLPPGGAERSTMTTLALGEEGGGGGTVFTTLVVGEEGTTAPWSEEMMPGPVIPQDPTTQIAGEGWYDPANQNPLGRR